jgi:hypothetical protein
VETYRLGLKFPIGGYFTKIQRIYDGVGTPHELIFTFTRLPAGADADNQIQYGTSITVNGVTVKRNDAAGAPIDSTGASMIMTFNKKGHFNLCDYGQPTESNVAPKLHIDWTDPAINGASLDIDLKLGRGKGATPTAEGKTYH